MSEKRGCCEGVEALTPLGIANRPALNALAYRAGTHGIFLAIMKARLSSSEYPALAGLSTRDQNDPVIALLDAFATVGDLLTFYNERIANEGYLATATERRSIFELARLVGYEPRPGVSASVYLAFSQEDGYEGIIPAGTRAQSIPNPGELPQPFETSEDLEARAAWNALTPRLSRPQSMEQIISHFRVYLKGIGTNLGPNDPILLVRGPDQMFFRVKSVEPDPAADRTLLTLQATKPKNILDKDEQPDSSSGDTGGSRAMRELRQHGSDASPKAESADDPRYIDPVSSLIDSLGVTSPALPPTAPSGGISDLAQAFGGTGGKEADITPRAGGNGSPYSVTDASIMAFKAMEPAQGEALTEAMGNVTGQPDGPKLYALRVTASPYGHNALRPGDPRLRKDWTLREQRDVVTLDGAYKGILPESWIVIERPENKEATLANGQSPPEGEQAPGGTIITRAKAITECSRADYGITSARSTEVRTCEAWLNPDNERFDVIRRTSVHAQSESLELAEAPVEEVTNNVWRLSPVSGNKIELDSRQFGLKAGRWLVVSGEREKPSGVIASELVRLAGVEHGVERTLPGDVMVSTLVLEKKLAHAYKRETVKVYANVARATHGETRREVLGSGDFSKELQRFKLLQAPLTYIAAATSSGVESTLKVQVNGVSWHEAETLARLEPTDRCYATRTSFVGETTDVEETMVLFGDGRHGARLPTGTENVEAVYRTGLGRAGNVAAGQISQLGATRPLGLAGVTNPLRSTGGADPEPKEGVKSNVPLATVALDRLVSTRDYEDFARTFVGIGKASATRFGHGPSSLVHLTIAGRDDVPIAEDSDLLRNLLSALHSSGDPRQRVQVDTRDLELIVIDAGVRLLADYLWAAVEPDIRSSLLREFGFNQRELGQQVALSEVRGVIQRVPGVDYVDIETFGGVPEKRLDKDTGHRLPLTPEQIVDRIQYLVRESRVTGHPRERIVARLARPVEGYIFPARLAFLTPEVPQTLILSEITA